MGFHSSRFHECLESCSGSVNQACGGGRLISLAYYFSRNQCKSANGSLLVWVGGLDS